MKNQFKINDGGRSKYHECKRKMDNTGDCVIRAIAIALDLDYLEVKKELFARAIENGFMPNSARTFEPFLKERGWIKKSPMKNARTGRKILLGMLPVDCTMIVHTTSHIVAVVDGVINDTWDCREWCANSYFIKANN
jgi:predicted transcriptional regulator